MNSKHLGTLISPVLLFGGPYSNLQATQAMRAEADRLHIPSSHCICTGDTVAYCAQPEETVREIRDWGCHVILGNCEENLGNGKADCGCGFDGDSACAVLSNDWYPYSQGRLSQDSRDWMLSLSRGLRFSMHDHSFQVLHGALSAINRFIYASSPSQTMEAELDMAGGDVVIGGHCGLPFGSRVGTRYWLNSGVIGMPANDGTADGWYLLIKPLEQGLSVDWQRLSYDNKAANQAMNRHGLNNGYADCLLSGLWPSMDSLPLQERARQGMKLSLPSMLIPR